MGRVCLSDPIGKGQFIGPNWEGSVYPTQLGRVSLSDLNWEGSVYWTQLGRVSLSDLNWEGSVYWTKLGRVRFSNPIGKGQFIGHNGEGSVYRTQ